MLAANSRIKIMLIREFVAKKSHKKTAYPRLLSRTGEAISRKAVIDLFYNNILLFVVEMIF